MRFRLSTVAGLALLLPLVVSGPAESHVENDELTHSHDTQGWSVLGMYVEASGPHGAVGPGRADVWAFVTTAPQHTTGSGFTLKVYASLWTRLAGLVKASAPINRVGGQVQGYSGSAHGFKIWNASPIDSKGQIYLRFGSSQNGRTSEVGHKPGSVTAVDQATTTEGAFETSIETGGTPEIEEGEIVLDENDEVVWETPPTTLVRLTSSVLESGGSYTYTYKLENLGSEDLDFVIPEVTTLSFPSGWTGTVSGSSYEEISIVDTATPWSQHATVSVTDTEGSLSSEQVTTGRVYVPEERLVYAGTNTISDSYYDAVLQANVIEFSVSDDAELALLLHVDTCDDEVDEVENPTSGPTYQLEDYGFLPSEDNDYRVRTGSGVNGWELAGVVTISN